MKVIACFASTLDGKIADKSEPRARIGSEADLIHLRKMRAGADAILCGGETFRQYPNVRKAPDSPVAPLQCVLTRKFDLPPDAKLFQADPAVSVVIFSPDPAPDAVKSRYPAHVEWVAVGEGNPAPAISDNLSRRGVQTLLMEGGGHLMHLFLKAKAVHEISLTLCPLFLGGADDPGLVSGAGFAVSQAPRTEVITAEWVGQEQYLHLRIVYPDAPYSAI